MGDRNINVSRLLVGVALVGVALASHAPAVQADLTVNSWDLRVEASDADGSGAYLSDSTVSNSFTETRLASDGLSSNRTVYNFNWGAAGGTFNWGFTHQRAGAFGSFARSTVSNINFTVTGADMLYDLSGVYAMLGEQGILGQVSLFDRTPYSLTPSVFTWVQESRSSPNEALAVGEGDDGDFTAVLFPGLSGILERDHTYELSYTFSISAHADSESIATAVGDLQFSIQSAPVPAPGAALLAMMGLPLVGWFKRRYA